MCAHTCAWVYIYIYIHTHTCMGAYTDVCMHVFACIQLIGSQVNRIPRLEIELANCYVAVQCICHNTTATILFVSFSKCTPLPINKYQVLQIKSKYTNTVSPINSNAKNYFEIVRCIWCNPIYPTPPFGQDMIQGQFFKWSLTGFNSEFSFSLTSCLTKAEETSLLYYLSIAGGRIIGFIPFPRVLVLFEMQSVSYKI